MENLTLKPTGWDKLAKLIEGQSVSGLSNSAAVGLLKLLINTKKNYAYRMAVTKIRLLLADSLDDCYASGEIATWVPLTMSILTSKY